MSDEDKLKLLLKEAFLVRESMMKKFGWKENDLDGPEAEENGEKVERSKIKMEVFDIGNYCIYCNTREEVESVLAWYNPANQTPENLNVDIIDKVYYYLYIDITGWRTNWSWSQTLGTFPGEKILRKAVRFSDVEFIPVAEKEEKDLSSSPVAKVRELCSEAEKEFVLNCVFPSGDKENRFAFEGKGYRVEVRFPCLDKELHFEMSIKEEK